jgi:hypothetical protein
MLRLATVSILAAVLAFASPVVGGEQSAAITPTTPIRLFDGASLANFDTWLVDHHTSDPERVYTVVDQIDGAPAIRVSGKIWGGFVTKQAYRNYRLIVEYRWGGATWGTRRDRTRDSGVLLHAQGRLGNTQKDFNGPWMLSQEFQIIEGGVGDYISVAGFTEAGEQVRPSLTMPVRKDRDGERVWDPKGTPTVVNSGRVNWWGRSEDWTDTLGFRGPRDVESAGTAWTRLEAIADGASLKYYVNGTLVLEGTDSSLTEGRIMFQSEGAEIYFRRIDLEPLR